MLRRSLFLSIALALCGLLLKNPKADDSLLLYSYVQPFNRSAVSQYCLRILSTPLMALKKRVGDHALLSEQIDLVPRVRERNCGFDTSLTALGYNVERILNQHREERLRVRAEAIRDVENAAAEAANDISTVRDDQSIKSDSAMSQTSTAVGSDSGPQSKTRSLLDKLKRSKRDSSTGPGAFTNMVDQFPSATSGGLPQFGGSSSPARSSTVLGGGGGGNTTKRVRLSCVLCSLS